MIDVTAESAWLDEQIGKWFDRDSRTPHCSRCVHARVRGTSLYPLAYCARGHGDGDMPLVRLLAKGARGFQPAARCMDYEEATEEEACT